MTTESAVENVTMTTKQEDKPATIKLSVEDASMSIKQEAISAAKIGSKESVSRATKDAAKSTDLLSDNVRAINSPTGRPAGKLTPDESLTDRDVLEIRMNLTELLEETISDESLEEAASRPLVEVTLEQEAEEEAEEEPEQQEEEEAEQKEVEQKEAEQKEEEEDESLEEAASRPLVEVTLEQEEDGQTDLPWEPLFLNSSSGLRQEEDLTEEDNEEWTGGRLH
jgi:predicted ribosome quality control (RQC) complex YloA/Tae2 family protein